MLIVILQAPIITNLFVQNVDEIILQVRSIYNRIDFVAQQVEHSTLNKNKSAQSEKIDVEPP